MFMVEKLIRDCRTDIYCNFWNYTDSFFFNVKYEYSVNNALLKFHDEILALKFVFDYKIDKIFLVIIITIIIIIVTIIINLEDGGSNRRRLPGLCLLNGSPGPLNFKVLLKNLFFYIQLSSTFLFLNQFEWFFFCYKEEICLYFFYYLK